LAYKRYIHKQGKRHGPYYYKNVRDENGNVKSIYMGKAAQKGKKPLKFLIFLLLLSLITISGFYFYKNNYINQLPQGTTTDSFEIDQLLIKVLIKDNEYLEKNIRITNTGNNQIALTLEVSGIEDIVIIKEKEFTLSSKETKTIPINLTSFNEFTTKEPGIYIGKITASTSSYQTQVPVIIEIESQNVLFDMNLNPVALNRQVTAGDATTFEIRVFNLQNSDSSVDMNYFVKDLDGNTVISESENVVVKTQASFFKTLRIPENLKSGEYIFAASSSSEGSVGTASYLFEIEGIKKQETFVKFTAFCKDDRLCLATSAIASLLVLTILIYLYLFAASHISKRAPQKVIEKQVIVEIEKPKQQGFLTKWMENRRKAKDSKERRKLELKKEKLIINNHEEAEKIRKEKEGLRQNKLREKEKTSKEKKRKIHNFFRKLGLVKSEKEIRELEIKKRIDEMNKNKELERRKSQEEKLRVKEERVKQKEDQRRKKQEVERERIDAKKKFQEIKKEVSENVKELIDNGYRALEKDDLRKADKIYSKIRNKYFQYPKEIKLGFSKDVNSFYKLILKHHSEAQKMEEEVEYEEKKRKKEEEERNRKEIGERRILLEEKVARKKELEKERGIEREKIEAEIKEEKREVKEEKGTELGVCRRLLIKCYRALERGNMNKAERLYEKMLFRYTKLPIEQKREIYDNINDFYKNLMHDKKEIGMQDKHLTRELLKHQKEERKISKADMEKRRKGKSNKFAKCHKLLVDAEYALRRGDTNMASELYLKSRDIYVKLDYTEKKDIYKEITDMYNKLRK